MTTLEKQHFFRTTLTVCPRCKLQPGSQEWPKSWLNEVTITDGLQSVHAVLCRRPSCSFAEIIGLRAESRSSATRSRRAWLRNAITRHPFTFAAAAVVYGVALGLLVTLR
jgi:hypothetical protein